MYLDWLWNGLFLFIFGVLLYDWDCNDTLDVLKGDLYKLFMAATLSKYKIFYNQKQSNLNLTHYNSVQNYC